MSASVGVQYVLGGRPLEVDEVHREGDAHQEGNDEQDAFVHL